MSSNIVRDTWDNVVIVTRDGVNDQTWDGKVKNLIYDVDTMSWIAQTASAGGGGGGGDASAANQLTEISYLSQLLSRTPEQEYAILTDESTPGLTYVGYATPGAATSVSDWKIKLITESSTGTTVQFAEGNTDYDKIWDDRELYTYS